MIFGCRTAFRIYISRVTLSMSAYSAILSFSNILIATCECIVKIFSFEKKNIHLY